MQIGMRLLRPTLLMVVAGVVSQQVAKRMTSGDEDSDAFTLAAILGGKQFESRAASLRSASVLAVVGGVEIDLSGATLDASGGRLDVTAFMGGVEVQVPHGWAVEVENHGKMSGVDVRLNDPADVPDGAPTLSVRTKAWLGGVEIKQDRR